MSMGSGVGSVPLSEASFVRVWAEMSEPGLVKLSEASLVRVWAEMSEPGLARTKVESRALASAVSSGSRWARASA